MVNTSFHRLSLLALSGAALFLCSCGGSTPAPTATGSVPSGGTSGVITNSGSSSSGRFAYLRDLITGSGSVAANTTGLTGTGAFVNAPRFPITSSSSSAVARPLIASIGSTAAGSGLWTSMSDVLSISVKPDRLEVFPGEIVRFTIRICNKSVNELSNIPVAFAYSGYEMHFISATDGGVYSPGMSPDQATVDGSGVRFNQDRVDWIVPFLGAGETKILTVTMRMDQGLHRGDVVRGDAISAPVRAIAQVRILERMPMSGADSSNPYAEPPLIDESWSTAPTEAIRPDILFAPVR